LEDVSEMCGLVWFHAEPGHHGHGQNSGLHARKRRLFSSSV
jgi:hypothetical protein